MRIVKFINGMYAIEKGWWIFKSYLSNYSNYTWYCKIIYNDLEIMRNCSNSSCIKIAERYNNYIDSSNFSKLDVVEKYKLK